MLNKKEMNFKGLILYLIKINTASDSCIFIQTSNFHYIYMEKVCKSKLSSKRKYLLGETHSPSNLEN